MTKYQKAYDALVNKGQELTTKQISSRFGIANPYDVVYTLRANGFNIVNEKTTNRNGTSTTKYRYVASKTKKR
jgi:hypothetical protein